MADISLTLRQLVIERASGLCEYCHIQQIVVVFMEIDHIIPLSAGGKTISDNLCLACPGCNGYKSDNQLANDPETRETIRLFNPRHDRWRDHFQWAKDGITIIGLTPIAKVTIIQLKMNRPSILASRQIWHNSGWHPPSSDT